MFCADGTAYIYYEESDGFEVEKFSYIYNAEKGKIIGLKMILLILGLMTSRFLQIAN